MHFLPNSLRRTSIATIVLCSTCSPSFPTFAQSTAQQIDDQQQRLQRERTQDQLRRAAPDTSVLTPFAADVDVGQLPRDEQPCFAIRDVTLSGERAAEFQWALPAADLNGEQADPVSAHCVGAKGINTILGRVQNAIIARGFATTRVVAQPQDVSKGTLALTLVPGVIHAIKVQAEPQRAINGDQALALSPNALLNTRDIDQSLENLKRIPGADANIDIVPATGAGPGQSDLNIRYQQDKFWRISLGLDNGGSESTGPYQGSMTLSADNWLGLQELLYVTLNHSLGGDSPGPGNTRGNTVYFSMPWSYNVVSLSASHSSYSQTVAGLTTDIVYSGKSSNADLKLSRMVYRNQNAKTKLSLGAFARDANSYIDGLEVEVQRKATGGWQLGIDHESALEGGKWAAGLNYKRGTGAFGSLRDAGELFGETNSRFRLLTANASIEKKFNNGGKQWQVSSHWHAQTHGTRLTTSDWFSIGGRYSVRGFDGRQALSAEAGWTLRNELGVDLVPQAAQAYFALDLGSVHGPSAALLTGRSLAGAALGLRGQQGAWSYDISVAAPIAHPEGFRSSSPTYAFNLNVAF